MMFDYDWLGLETEEEEPEKEVSEYQCPNDSSFLDIVQEGYLYRCAVCNYEYRRIYEKKPP